MTAPLPSGESVAGNLPACAFLKSFKLFRTLEDSDWPVLFEAARIVRCEANQLIIREGDKGDELYLIMSGSVQVLLQQADRNLDLAPLGRGAFFGEVGFLTGRPRTASVIAKTPVELVVLSRAGVDSLLKKHPRLRKLIQTVMEGRARATIEAIEKARG